METTQRTLLDETVSLLYKILLVLLREDPDDDVAERFDITTEADVLMFLSEHADILLEAVTAAATP